MMSLTHTEHPGIKLDAEPVPDTVNTQAADGALAVETHDLRRVYKLRGPKRKDDP
ncbi:MAG: hypothetical protein GWN03_10505, partial [Gammaproteobacteria bacterium]|nr:hypothetical protein [Gammaproteobacteria bacterium]